MLLQRMHMVNQLKLSHVPHKDGVTDVEALKELN